MPGRSSLLKHDADRAGVPLTPSHTQFALTEIRGDWEFHRDLWRTTASWNGNLTCFRCPCVAKGPEPLLYWNYGDSSEWKHQEFGTEQFIARRLRTRNLCPLIKLRGFHPSILRWCTMHTLNLGLMFTANGGSLILLAEELQYFGPDTFGDQIDRAYQHFTSFCRSRKIQHSQPPFTRKMVKKKSGENLFTAKAYNGRVILMWLTHCLLDSEQHNPDHEILVLTCAAMSSLAKFMALMEENPRHLTASAAQSMHDAGFRFLNFYKILCLEYIRKGVSAWLLKPKYHVFAHICMDALAYRVNPRFTHTFVDEDSMKWVKCISARAHPRQRERWVLRTTKLRLLSMKSMKSRRTTRRSRQT